MDGSQNRLQMKDVDWNMIQEWAEAGPNRAEGATLVEFQNCPDELIEDYVNYLIFGLSHHLFTSLIRKCFSSSCKKQPHKIINTNFDSKYTK